MRKISAVLVCAFVVILAGQIGSAAPPVRLVSPVLEINVNQRLVCNVVNADDVDHKVLFTFYDSHGTVVSGHSPQIVPAHGTAGISFPPGYHANHCEITVDGPADVFRGSIQIIDTTAPVLPLVVASLPMW